MNHRRGIENPNDVVKTGDLELFRDKHGRQPITDHAAAGIEMARTEHRLICGTWEPVVLMLRGETQKRKSTRCKAQGRIAS